MEITARAFLFDEDERILLVKHAAGQPWVLPGGHLDEDDEGDIYTCLKREIAEEVGLEVTIIGSETKFSDRNVSALPLPVSIHRVKYEHRNRGQIERIEYWFFGRVFGDIDEIDTAELYDFTWATEAEIMDMEENVEIYKSIQDVLEQNIDLLELL